MRSFIIVSAINLTLLQMALGASLATRDSIYPQSQPHATKRTLGAANCGNQKGVVNAAVANAYNCVNAVNAQLTPDINPFVPPSNGALPGLNPLIDPNTAPNTGAYPPSGPFVPTGAGGFGGFGGRDGFGGTSISASQSEIQQSQSAYNYMNFGNSYGPLFAKDAKKTTKDSSVSA